MNRGADPLCAGLRDAAENLPDLSDPRFGAMFDRFADARVVLLGEASHGTSEFYRARDAITRRLVAAHGFRIVAVEADWPDAASVDRYVRHMPHRKAEPAFRRFPTWMWRNLEVEAFIEWLRAWNERQPEDGRAGFHGLDLYSLNSSIRAVIDYLDRVDPDTARVARERYGCLTPWVREPSEYGRIALDSGFAPCEQAVLDVLRELLDRHLEFARHGAGAFLDAAHNARLVSNAEAYYRAMYQGSAESWNLRDTHMFETLELLLAAGGEDSKAVVWAHNSHIGDARFTEMGTERRELNIGQLCRESYGSRAALIGFGTDSGTVAAASNWDEPMEVMHVRPSRTDSYEGLCHQAGLTCQLLDLREGVHPDLRERLVPPRLERFIGVIYRPETERWSHYADASLPHQFDAWVWFDRTRAVTALPTTPRRGLPETYPFGL